MNPFVRGIPIAGETFQSPEIDMFASRLNKQLAKNASWMPDPGSTVIDSMTISWKKKIIFAFPSFSMTWPTNKKIEQDARKALMFVPMWSAQIWFTRVLELAEAAPFIIGSQ